MGRSVFIFYFFAHFSALFRCFSARRSILPGVFGLRSMGLAGAASWRGPAPVVARREGGSGQCRASVWSAWSLLPLSVRPRLPESASKLDAVQTLRESGRHQGFGFQSCRLCFFHAQSVIAQLGPGRQMLYWLYWLYWLFFTLGWRFPAGWGVNSMPFGNCLAPAGGRCPEGTFENSPAFQRWVLRSDDPKSRRSGRERLPLSLGERAGVRASV